MSRTLPVVAVVGRPNVGKSTFFNRVLGRRIAIVDDRPGVTRDRNFARAEWAGHAFYIVDTGGVVEGSDEPMDRLIRKQAMAAVDEADVILLLVDSREGLHPLDQRIAEVIRGKGRPILVVANKVDNLPNDPSYHDFWSLGLGEPIPVSAISGKGSGDLLDAIVAAFPEEKEDRDAEDRIRVAVVGKPNVGKSSFVNQLFGEERSVVSPEAGTTRDAVDSTLNYHGRELVFVDTAGLRRQSRMADSLEYYSSLRTDRVIREADVCLVLADASEGVATQDIRVMETAWEAGCGMILVLNKWDLVEKDTMTAPRMENELKARYPFTEWVPKVFTSAETGQRVRKTLDLILQVEAERHRRIPTNEVNEVLEGLVRRQPPPHARGREVKLKYGTQVDTAPPSFVVFSNFPKDIPDHYIRFIQKGFREAWGFVGSPLRLRFKSSRES